MVKTSGAIKQKSLLVGTWPVSVWATSQDVAKFKLEAPSSLAHAHHAVINVDASKYENPCATVTWNALMPITLCFTEMPDMPLTSSRNGDRHYTLSDQTFRVATWPQTNAQTFQANRKELILASFSIIIGVCVLVLSCGFQKIAPTRKEEKLSGFCGSTILKPLCRRLVKL